MTDKMLLTPVRFRKKQRNAQMVAYFNKLMQEPGAMRTRVYDIVAEKFCVGRGTAIRIIKEASNG